MKILGFIALSLMVFGCAKDKSYEKLLKENVYTKDFFLNAEKEDYLYLVSVGNTPKDITASRPYWQGQEKLVKFRFNDSSLEMVEKVADERYQNNDLNELPVLTFSIDHVGYQCKKDEFGDCTNEEEEVKDIPAEKRSSIKIKNVKYENNASLPIASNNIFSRCFSEIDSEITETKLEKDALNFTVRKTFQAGIECADVKKWEDLKNTKFSVDYYHSITKLAALASPNYEAVDYPYKDVNTYGFFPTTKYRLSVDNSSNDESEKAYLNRFNPKNKEIVYYLNSEFYKKGMESILLSTIEGIDRVNDSFKEAGVDTKIVLKDGSKLPIGDLRYNFIILVKDPQASGVIGYGPSVTNPKTGEILNARTVMYYGTMKKYVKYTYDDIVKELNGGNVTKKTTSEATVLKKFKQSTKVKKGDHDHNHGELLNIVSDRSDEPYRDNINQIDIAGLSKDVIRKEIFSLNRKLDFKTIDQENPLKQIEEMSRMNVYHGSMFNFHSAVTAGLSNTNSKNLKLWEELTESEQEKLIERLLPFAWVPTLVHEFGHNLGLRHNFNGSEDKENFYTNQERVIMGVKKPIQYSSVMDYAYSELNSLPKMGKYDIAALRFGYKREVETDKGEFIKLSGDLSTADAELHKINIAKKLKIARLEQEKTALATELKKTDDKKTIKLITAKIEATEKKLETANKKISKLKNYQFCTDEHVAVNPGCNRFDEGVDLNSIVDHYIDSYYKGYERRNLRGNRESFGGYDDMGYLAGLHGRFRTLRLVFEIYDRINQMYTLSAEDWDKIEFLKDLKQATTKVNKFFINVIKTPGLNCLLIDKDGAIAGNYSLSSKIFAPEGDLANCFESEQLTNFAESNNLTMAQFGKNLDHAKSKDMKDHLKPYSNEVSVRGIWMDKALALKFMSMRKMDAPNFNESLTTFFDYPEFASEIASELLGVFKDELSARVDVTIKSNDEYVVVPGASLNYSLSKSSHFKPSFHPGVNQYLKVTDETNDLKKVLLKNLKPNLKADRETELSIFFEDSLKTYKLDRNIKYPYTQFELDTQENKIPLTGKRYGLYTNNVFAKVTLGQIATGEALGEENVKLLTSLNVYSVDSLKDLDKKILANIYSFRLAQETFVMSPEQIKAYEKTIAEVLKQLPGYEASFQIGLSTLEKYLEGTLEDFVIDSMEALSL